MRKFKFIGTEEAIREYSYRPPQKGMIYTEDSLIGLAPLREWMDFSFFDSEWEEVFEEEKVQLTETEKIVLIDFLNDHFEEFCAFIDAPTKTFYENFDMLDQGLSGGTEPKVIISNLIDKIEKL